MSGLESYSDAELQQELRRRKAASKPIPAWRCERCGAVGYYTGHFRPAWFEIQQKTFRERHRDCPAYFGGGGI